MGTPISARIDIGKDDNRQNMFAKPLSENYEDELARAFEEKARISKLEELVSNIERRLNNDNRNKYQSNMGRRLNNGNRNSYQSNQNRYQHVSDVIEWGIIRIIVLKEGMQE
ncbi:unnamed protein product [Rhizophagus irregularis]|uniref:Uncharacterized protein n=1 Tax=Rhizophagus irregularis TaxID=588596 RepID=A0A916ELA6_9GLOM|nr:unnamed protein product [Rhizophagus irregularis]